MPLGISKVSAHFFTNWTRIGLVPILNDVLSHKVIKISIPTQSCQERIKFYPLIYFCDTVCCDRTRHSKFCNEYHKSSIHTQTQSGNVYSQDVFWHCNYICWLSRKENTRTFCPHSWQCTQLRGHQNLCHHPNLVINSQIYNQPFTHLFLWYWEMWQEREFLVLYCFPQYSQSNLDSEVKCLDSKWALPAW